MKPEEDKDFGLGICDLCGLNGQETPMIKNKDYCANCLKELRELHSLKNLITQRNKLNRQISHLKKVERDYIYDDDMCGCGERFVKPSNWKEGSEIFCYKCGTRISEKPLKKAKPIDEDLERAYQEVKRKEALN